MSLLPVAAHANGELLLQCVDHSVGSCSQKRSAAAEQNAALIAHSDCKTSQQLTVLQVVMSNFNRHKPHYKYAPSHLYDYGF
jgi:alpha-amylase/alpha-mannosidase (GH57 family)